LVKKVRKSTVLPNQRMQASSKKRMAKLMRKRCRSTRRGRHRGLAGTSEAIVTPDGLGAVGPVELRQIEPRPDAEAPS
jgi:hypothetical protein